MEVETNKMENKVPFEEALNRTGFGLHSYLHTLLTGLNIIAFVCVGYGSSILVPASACELNTTGSQQGVLAAAPLIGSIIGALLWGYLGDTRGRRSMLLTCLALAMIFNAIGSISVNWIMLMIFQFIATLMASGQYTLSVTLLSECIPFAKRNVIMLMVASIFLLSQGIMAILAIPVIPLTFSHYLPALGIYWNSWRTLMLIYCIPNVICFVWLMFMPESPKYLLLKGQEQEALDVLRLIHRRNNGKSSQEFDVKGLQHEVSVQAVEDKSSKDTLLLFKMPLVKYTAIIAILYVFQQVGSFQVWLPTIANQFVQIVQTGDGDGNNLCGIIRSSLADTGSVSTEGNPCNIDATALLMVFGVGCMQSLVNLCISSVVDRVGRRNMVIIVTTICGLSGIIVNLIPNTAGSVTFFTIFLMGIVVVGIYTAMAVALFPTQVRASALSLTIATGRLFTFAAIQILNYLLANSCETGFYIYATLFGSSAIVASFLPDDRFINKPAPKKEDCENKEEAQ